MSANWQQIRRRRRQHNHNQKKTIYEMCLIEVSWLLDPQSKWSWAELRPIAVVAMNGVERYSSLTIPHSPHLAVRISQNSNVHVVSVSSKDNVNRHTDHTLIVYLKYFTFDYMNTTNIAYSWLWAWPSVSHTPKCQWKAENKYRQIWIRSICAFPTLTHVTRHKNPSIFYSLLYRSGASNNGWLAHQNI